MKINIRRTAMTAILVLAVCVVSGLGAKALVEYTGELFPMVSTASNVNLMPGDGYMSAYLEVDLIQNEDNPDITQGVRLEWLPPERSARYRVYRVNPGERIANETGFSGVIADIYDAQCTTYVDVNVEPGKSYDYYIECWGEIDPVPPVYLTGGRGFSNIVNVTVGSERREVLYTNSVLMQVGNPYMCIAVPEVRPVGHNIVALPVGHMTCNMQSIDGDRGTVPIISDDRAMLPIRAIVEATGGSVRWDQDSKKITLSANNFVVEMWIGSTEYKINGSEYSMDTMPFIENDRTYLPIRFVAESLNYTVTWISENKEVLIEF